MPIGAQVNLRAGGILGQIALAQLDRRHGLGPPDSSEYKADKGLFIKLPSAGLFSVVLSQQQSLLTKQDQYQLPRTMLRRVLAASTLLGAVCAQSSTTSADQEVISVFMIGAVSGGTEDNPDPLYASIIDNVSKFPYNHHVHRPPELAFASHEHLARSIG